MGRGAKKADSPAPRGTRKEKTVSQQKKPVGAAFPWTGSFLTRKEKRYARYYFDRRFDFDGGGCNTHVASQPKVGLLSQRTAGCGPADSGNPAASGSALELAKHYCCYAQKSATRV